MKQVQYLKEHAPFFDLLSSSGIELKKVNCIDAHGPCWVRERGRVQQEEQQNVNIVVAAYTTSYGRLQLYNCLEKLDWRVLYFDTGENESIIAVLWLNRIA